MTVLSKEAVIIARKPEATRHPVEFAPMHHTLNDDELVYGVPVRRHLPSFSFSRALAGKQSLFFECLAMGRYALVANVPVRRFAHIRCGVGHGFPRAF